MYWSYWLSKEYYSNFVFCYVKMWKKQNVFRSVWNEICIRNIFIYSIEIPQSSVCNSAGRPPSGKKSRHNMHWVQILDSATVKDKWKRIEHYNFYEYIYVYIKYLKNKKKL